MPNQRNLLAALAHHPSKAIHSKTFAQTINMQTSSFTTALETLLSDDFIYKTSHGAYHVTDPAIESYLLQIDFFDIKGLLKSEVISSYFC